MEKYSLIDMHLHSIYSHEKGVTNSPQNLINMALNNAHDGRKVAISITDHNNVRATGAALRYIEEENLQDRVDYFSGAEFNAGAKSLGKFNFKGNRKSIFGSLHLLGYGFNENDEELTAFSDLRALYVDGVNIGDQICAGRNLIKQETGVDIPFHYLTPLIASAKNGGDVYKEFISTAKNYSNLVGEPLNVGTIMNILGVYFNSDFKNNDMATGKAKLDIEDICHMIKNAGGICVVAHPTYITYKQKAILHDVSAMDEFLYSVNSKEKLVDGFEFFYPVMSNFKEFPLFYELALKHNMFVSAGSDYHGFAEKFPRQIGKVFDIQVDLPQSDFFYSKETKNRVVYLPIVEYLKYRKQLQNKYSFAMEIENKGELSDKEAIVLLSQIQSEAKAHAKPKIEDRFKQEMSAKKLDVLNAIKTLQTVNSLTREAILNTTPENRKCEIYSELRAILTKGFFSIYATNKHFNQFNFVQNNLDDFKHYVALVGVVKSTFEVMQELSKEFKFENRDLIKAIEGLHIKYAHNIVDDEHIVPEIEILETNEGKIVKIKDESLLKTLGLSEEDLIREHSSCETDKRPTVLKKALKCLSKIETLYTVVLNDKVPENIRADSFGELKNILNSGISSINATIINFYDVKYIEENPKCFREFVDSIEAIKGLSCEVEERNIPYASGNTKIYQVFDCINLEELTMGKSK